jgi:hypothetical protein
MAFCTSATAGGFGNPWFSLLPFSGTPQEQEGLDELQIFVAHAYRRSGLQLD